MGIIHSTLQYILPSTDFSACTQEEGPGLINEYDMSKDADKGLDDSVAVGIGEIAASDDDIEGGISDTIPFSDTVDSEDDTVESDNGDIVDSTSGIVDGNGDVVDFNGDMLNGDNDGNMVDFDDDIIDRTSN